MKILGFYITRMDWKTLYKYQLEFKILWRDAYWNDTEALKKQLAQAKKNDMPRDPKTGRFISKMKAVHDKLRAEVAAKAYADNSKIGHYDDAKNAGGSHDRY